MATATAQVCKVYSYKMINDAPTFENMLWTCGGQVIFQGSMKTTSWHGSCVEGAFRTLSLRFHHNGGEERQWRTTTVLEVEPGVYRGMDYKHREIEMRLLGTYVYQPAGARGAGSDPLWILVRDESSGWERAAQ